MGLNVGCELDGAQELVMLQRSWAAPLVGYVRREREAAGFDVGKGRAARGLFAGASGSMVDTGHELADVKQWRASCKAGAGRCTGQRSRPLGHA